MIACARLLAASGTALILAGCAGTPKLHEIKALYVCAEGECASASRRYDSRDVIDALAALLRANNDQEFRICESDPRTRSCVAVGAGHFVMGGPIPGIGSAYAAKIWDAVAEPEKQRLVVQMQMYKKFIGTPVVCAAHQMVIAVRSVDEVVGEDSPHYCNWMGVGNMTATFNFAVETIDMERGVLAGYWAHALVGSGNGSGTGYATWEFPKPVADWRPAAR